MHDQPDGSAAIHTGPGRVNLIGDHTDYNQGLALPMAIGLGVTVAVTRSTEDRILVTSDAYPSERAVVPLVPDVDDVVGMDPAWARLVAALVLLARPTTGLKGGHERRRSEADARAPRDGHAMHSAEFAGRRSGVARPRGGSPPQCPDQRFCSG